MSYKLFDIGYRYIKTRKNIGYYGREGQGQGA